MKAILERYCEHGGMIRVYEDDNAILTTPYIWCCGCKFNHEGDPNCIYMGGFSSKLPGPTAGWEAIRIMLRDEGFRFVVWERRKRGQLLRAVKVDTTSGAIAVQHAV